MTLSTSDVASYTAFACELADQARLISLDFFRRRVEIESKQDESPVTAADCGVEARLREMIRARFPGHGVYGEEFDNEGLDRDLIWIIDPIDGTRSFVTGTPTFGTLVGLIYCQQPVIGIIDMPALDERWLGVRGGESTFNSSPARTSQQTAIGSCRLATTAPEMFDAKQRRGFENIKSQTGFYRYGGDCYNYGLLASGFIDLVVEADLKPFDYVALVPVVEQAGGVITDWSGGDLTLTSPGEVIAAATPELHQEALALLSRRQRLRCTP